MKRMVATEIEYIRQIAQIHVQMLQNDPLAPRQSKMACALYEEMIQRRIDLSDDFVEAKVEQDQVMAFIWAHHEKATKTVTIESLYVTPKYGTYPNITLPKTPQGSNRGSAPGSTK
ncbi:hypothetical protein ACED91_09905, partial [Staphylococcus chromogenes]